MFFLVWVYVCVLYKREIVCNVYHHFIDAFSILGICPKGIICLVYAGEV